MKWLCLLIAFYIPLSFCPVHGDTPPLPAFITDAFGAKASKSNRILARAYRTGRTEFPIRCEGRISRILSDDSEGIRHQRFILRLSNGQTLLIVHNIDLALRIQNLAVRDRVVVKGEYIWNELGGLIHYTHRDPDGEGFHGYIRHKKQLYR